MKSVAYCRNLVGEVEALEGASFARFRAHSKYAAFADEYLTAKCVTDFWWFLVFGVYFRGMKHYDPRAHRPIARWLGNWTKAENGVQVPVKVKWQIVSRGECKTQLLIAWDAWQFVQDVNYRGMVRAYTDGKAQQISGSVMQLLLMPSFQRRFPWVRPAMKGRSQVPVKWTPAEFLLAREDQGVRVSSLVAFGLEGEPTGDHYHFGHYDDVEVRTNAQSDTLLKQLFDVWNNDDNLFEAGSKRGCAGTPWSRAGLVHGILHRTNGMESHDYDVYRQPCWYKAFDTVFAHHGPVLLGDRRTIRADGAGYPTAMETLTTCQARVRFWGDAASDVVEEVREVVWNDGSHFRVNRPFPAFLGQPLGCEVGPYKPAFPVRDTMDVQDWEPSCGGELPAEVEAHKTYPGVVELNSRISLPGKRKSQGISIFTAQMLLEAVSDTDRIWNPDDIRIVTLAELPEGERRWYRTTDFAGSDKKRRNPASTSMTTGFYHARGLFITHICFHQTMGSNAKLLELVLGVLRVKQWNGRLRETTFETSSAIERTLKDFLPQVERDPFKYFSELADSARSGEERRPFENGPTYAELAGKHFVPGERVPVVRRWIPRKASKLDRIENASPEVEGGRVHILDTCPFLEVLFEQAKSCTRGASGSFDLLDNIADLVTEYGPRRKMQDAVVVESGDTEFDRLQREGLERSLVASGVVGVPGWK